MIIIGAGLAGLLAARKFNHLDPIIVEKQNEIPNNHSALLRFRTHDVADLIGVPFREVLVTKAVMNEERDIVFEPTLRDINSYSYKVMGAIHERSILNLRPGVRYIAPLNMIELLSKSADIQIGAEANPTLFSMRPPIISTMPMPALMDLLEYPNKPEFVYRPIWTVNCTMTNMDAYQTLYDPYKFVDDPSPYRISITGNRFTLEYMNEPQKPNRDIPYYVNKMFGREYMMNNQCNGVTTRLQPYGKIMPIDDSVRKHFIFWATNEHGVYSLGRFACWRQILLDDLVKDLRMISQFITADSKYDRKKQ